MSVPHFVGQALEEVLLLVQSRARVIARLQRSVVQAIKSSPSDREIPTRGIHGPIDPAEWSVGSPEWITALVGAQVHVPNWGRRSRRSCPSEGTRTSPTRRGTGCSSAHCVHLTARPRCPAERPCFIDTPTWAAVSQGGARRRGKHLRTSSQPRVVKERMAVCEAIER